MAKKFTYSHLQARRKEKGRVSAQRTKARISKIGRSRGKTGGSRVRILP